LAATTFDASPTGGGGAGSRPLPRRAVTTALLALVAGVAVGRVVVDPDVRVRPAVTAAAPRTPEERIAALEASLRDDPDDVRALQQLATTKVRAVAAGADLALYVEAEAALARAERLAPGDPANDVAGGYLALARHDFARAHELGSRARRADPFDGDALAIVVDAEIELGRYDDAERSLARLLSVRPGLAAYSRLSYLRELHGDLEGASEALALAEVAGAGDPTDLATVAVLRARLALASGDLETAAEQLARSRRDVERPANADALDARLRIATHDLDGARSVLERAMRAAPTAEVALLLADLDAYEGRASDAGLDRFLARNAADERAAGADVDLEAALVAADRGRLTEAVGLALAAHARRPDSVVTSSALAWVLDRAGDTDGAVPFAERSLRLGTADALLRYRAAVVFAHAGDTPRAARELARALASNPWFSLRYAADARALATTLGVAVPEAWDQPVG
jgi:tetratricopeptide (TPR) repeat protein